MKTKHYDLVIFDCDGVLVDSEPIANRVYVQMLNEFGHQVNTDEYLREFSGAAMPHRLKVTSNRLNWAPPENFLSIFHERFVEMTAREVKPVPGIRDLIQSLSVPYCVASNGSREGIALQLKTAHLTDLFDDAIFSATEMLHPKPAPDVYLAAAKAFNLSPDRCIVIEDSIPGVTAGVRAGMKVYGHAAFTPSESLREAGAIPFHTMAELQKILAEQNDKIQQITP